MNDITGSGSANPAHRPPAGKPLPGDLAPKEFYARALARIDILEEMTIEQRALVASLGKEVTLPPNYILGTHSSEGDSLFLILEGCVELSVPTPVGYLAVRIVMGGESIPLSVLIGEGKLITTAVTTDTTSALVIPKQALLDLCTSRPDIGVLVFRSVARILGNRYATVLARLTEALGQKVPREVWANV